ncbi:MAG: FAD-binding protein [Nitrosopumilus sp.]|nr:FAD-binding protein [Nitrosopumilus sp.]
MGGTRFHREEDGRLTQRFFGAHTHRRTGFYGDWTGNEIIRVLMQQVSKRKIDIIDNVCITKLLIKNSVKKEGLETELKGALGIDLEKKQLLKFKCKSLILASGGYTRVYSISSSRIYEHYGEGIDLAYEAGVDLVDMEMV